MNGFSRKKRIHSLWKRIVAAMCCVVVFITTYAMILPAITLDSETAENEPGITVTADAETSAVSMTEEDPAAEGETEPADAEQPDIGSEAGPADSGTEPVKEHAETVPAEDESADPENTEPENTETEKTAADPEETEPEPGAPEEEDGAQIADPEYRPACSLRARAGDVLVSVEAPEGAFPANVVMEAVIIENETVLSAIADTVEGRVRAIQAVDITFYDENGAEIQPAIPITVTMSSEVTERAEEIQVIHVDEDLNTEVVSEAETREDNCVEFSAGDFSVYAIVEYETITGLYLTSDGSTYEVTVRYTEEAGIPDGAELHVSELTENDAGYSYYLSRTADALGAQSASISYIKLLDIEITGADGAKKEPTAQVDVSVRLIDRAETGDPAHVVHFGEKTEELGSSSDGDIVSFCTDGFSVYAIADVQDPSELDGHSFGIINTVDGTNPSGTAVLAESTGDNLDRLKGKSTTVRVDVVSRDSNVYIPKDSDITMWTFSSCGDGKYYITADVDGQLRYLRISSDGVYLTDADSAVNDEDCRISVTKNNSTGSNAGKFKFSTGNGTLQLSGGNFRRARTNENGNAVWMSFAELSNLNEDDFVTYTAQKVSVS
ncbi:MAG: hypothetical protein IIU19_01960, partial [Oscillospiraceae bacterium]|nr:hypothetical protein [Oscillospiraceae bacterium]